MVEMENKFLHDFMRRQATLIETTVPEAPVARGGAGGGKKKKIYKSKHGTASGGHPFGGDDMEARLATLISETPAKKEVLAYFRDRIAQLVAEDSF